MTARAVSIADLKNNLGAHADLLPEEAALDAEGKIRLPRKPLPAGFWKTRAPRVPADRALEVLREDRDAR
jgi:hypothetical protein